MGGPRLVKESGRYKTNGENLCVSNNANFSEFTCLFSAPDGRDPSGLFRNKNTLHRFAENVFTDKTDMTRTAFLRTPNAPCTRISANPSRDYVTFCFSISVRQSSQRACPLFSSADPYSWGRSNRIRTSPGRDSTYNHDCSHRVQFSCSFGPTGNP